MTHETVPSSGEVALTAQGITLSYGRRRPVVAIDDVSLTIGRGEMMALLGPNGSGKSTLLRTLSGTVSPSRGVVTLFGRDIREMPAAQRARILAFVPQRVRIDLPFTVAEIVMMGRAPYQGRFGLTLAGDDEVVREAMQCTRVEHLGQRRMHELSGGEAQRVMLAQALAQQPQVLLLDEPTSHLDIGFQIEVMDLLASLHRERGLTVVVSLHDLNLASLYCGRTVMLRAGRLHAQGPSSDVLTASIVREVYGADVHVGSHPDGEATLISLRRRPRDDA